MRRFPQNVLIATLALLINPACAEQDVSVLIFKEGANAYESKAIASGLRNALVSSFETYLTDSHFPYGPYCTDNSAECRQHLSYQAEFECASFDLNEDSVPEVFVEMIAPGYCGSGGCDTYMLDNSTGSWKVIGVNHVFMERVNGRSFSADHPIICARPTLASDLERLDTGFVYVEGQVLDTMKFSDATVEEYLACAHGIVDCTKPFPQLYQQALEKGWLSRLQEIAVS